VDLLDRDDQDRSLAGGVCRVLKAIVEASFRLLDEVCKPRFRNARQKLAKLRQSNEGDLRIRRIY
jgi:hypothetical protein